jgi:hypothetical protein
MIVGISNQTPFLHYLRFLGMKNNYESQFTDEEIDNARKYVKQRYAKTNQKRFRAVNAVKCGKFHARKHIICLTTTEREKFIALF